MKYRLNFCKTSYIEFSQKEFNNFENVFFEDTKEQGKKITVKRPDGKHFVILVPIDLFERKKR